MSGKKYPAGFSFKNVLSAGIAVSFSDIVTGDGLSTDRRPFLVNISPAHSVCWKGRVSGLKNIRVRSPGGVAAQQ